MSKVSESSPSVPKDEKNDLISKIEKYRKEADSCSTLINRKTQEIEALKSETSELKLSLIENSKVIERMEHQKEKLIKQSTELLSTACECTSFVIDSSNVDDRECVLIIKKSVLQLFNDHKNHQERMVHVSRLKANLEKEIKSDKKLVNKLLEENAELLNKINKLQFVSKRSSDPPNRNQRPLIRNLRSLLPLSAAALMFRSSLLLKTNEAPSNSQKTFYENSSKLLCRLVDQISLSETPDSDAQPFEPMEFDKIKTREEIKNYFAGVTEKLEKFLPIWVNDLSELVQYKSKNKKLNSDLSQLKYELCNRQVQPKIKNCPCKMEINALKAAESAVRREIKLLESRLVQLKDEMENLNSSEVDPPP